MPTKLQACEQIAEKTATQITASHESWTDFLRTAARLYKYPYHEQLMIYAQRPDATACAGYEVWNEKMRRYIRRGSKGIALIDASGDRPGIRYVFDISDTGGMENSRRPYLWQYRPEHEDTVAAALEQEYAVSGEKGLADQLEQIAGQLANEYWQEHQYDILHIVDGSFLEEYDEFNIGAQFRSAATISTTYAVLSRCGLDPDEYFEHEDFLSIFDFNTPSTVAALGSAVSEASERVLRQIEVTVKNYEREHLAERSTTHGEQSDLQSERGLPDSRPDDHGAVREHREIREDAEELPERAPSGPVQQPAAVGEAVPAPVGNREDGDGAVGAHAAGADEIGGRDGKPESIRPDALGRAHEQPESAGRGNDSDGAYLQLSFFPSEQEQIQRIDEAESEKPSAFSIPSTQKTEKHSKESAIDTAKRATITSAFEHHAILNSCKAIERLGFPVRYIWPTSEGVITPDALTQIVTNQTRLVSIMFANNEIGTIQPIKELCDTAHVHGALFHTDAVQAVGHVKIDVQELGIDMLSASAHKFNGPKGIGFLYIRKGTRIIPYADGGAQENGYRAGTENIASIVGMAIALQNNCTHLEENVAYVQSMERLFLKELQEAQIPFIRNGGKNTLPGLLSLSFSGASGEAILHRMDLMGISISTGSACNSANTEISHVLKAIRLEEELAKGTVRISLGRNNTEEDVESIVGALTKILR